MYFNGEPAIGISITNVSGINVVDMGRAVDRFGAATSQMAAAALLGAGFAAAAFAHDIATLTVIHLAVGFGSSVSFGPLMADISHWFMRRRGVAVTVTASGNYLAGALWPWALSDVLAEDGWRMVYLLAKHM